MTWKFKKGDLLVYRAWGALQARVVKAHRDGTWTVEPCWWVVPDGDGWKYEGGNTVTIWPQDVVGPWKAGPTEQAREAERAKRERMRTFGPELFEALQEALLVLQSAAVSDPPWPKAAWARDKALAVLARVEVQS